jgi:hypothetical protein
MLPCRVTEVQCADMAHATTCIIRTIHTEWCLISSIIHVHHDGLVARELVKQTINKRFNVQYGT